MIEIALFEPDIAQNTGSILRLGACFGSSVHIIHPAGFLMNDRALERAGMDYLLHVERTEHEDWDAFQFWRLANGRRLCALTTLGSKTIHAFEFQRDDILLMGRESAGLPDPVKQACDARLRIPLARGMRSLNVAVAAGIATAEALRQTWQLPE